MSTYLTELYHYTNYESFLNIMRIGCILKAPSCLYMPKKLTLIFNPLTQHYEHADLEHDHIKRVVWLTDSRNAEVHGLYEKPHELRITVRTNSDYKYWMKWQKDNHMNKQMFRSLTKGTNYNSWWVSENEIPISDIVLVEEVQTGKVIYSGDRSKIA